jgi:hypothetical protein
MRSTCFTYTDWTFRLHIICLGALLVVVLEVLFLLKEQKITLIYHLIHVLHVRALVTLFTMVSLLFVIIHLRKKLGRLCFSLCQRYTQYMLSICYILLMNRFNGLPIISTFAHLPLIFFILMAQRLSIRHGIGHLSVLVFYTVSMLMRI